MTIPIVNHTRFDREWEAPPPRPIMIAGRDLRASAVMQPHHHQWGQLTYAVHGVMRVEANNSSWIVPPQRAVWIPPGVVHGTTVLEDTHLRPMRVYAGRAPFPATAARCWNCPACYANCWRRWKRSTAASNRRANTC
jgi:hypothetical protein